jgi:hypothetical protein
MAADFSNQRPYKQFVENKLINSPQHNDTVFSDTDFFQLV